jgi:hypothetical protein
LKPVVNQENKPMPPLIQIQLLKLLQISLRKQARTLPKKRGPSAANSESNTTAKDMDLAQDSDKEKAKVKKCQQRNLEEDDIKVFFSEPFRRKDDVSPNNII